MGKYNFDKVWERAGHNAIKWDVNPMTPRKTDPNFTPLPMWIADMDFATAPSVVEAMQERLNRPCSVITAIRIAISMRFSNGRRSVSA